MRDITVLKIGGSIATFKDRTEPAPREELLNAVFTNIAAQEKELQKNLILIHGAGPYGHALVHKYDLKSGTGSDDQKILRAMETRAAVQELNSAVLKAAFEADLPLFSIHPGSVVTQRDGQDPDVDIENLQHVLARGTIPLLYGEIVPDETLGYSVCSGDVLATALSKRLPVTHILFATDVDGIYSKDPHHFDDATLIENISLGKFTDDSAAVGDSHNTDVTGGLAGKLRACRDMFKGSQALEEIHIFNGLAPDNVIRALTGQPFSHTTLTK